MRKTFRRSCRACPLLGAGAGLVDRTGIERDLAGAVHELQALDVALVGVGDAQQAVEALHDVAQQLQLRRRRLDHHLLARAALDFRDREARAVVVFGVGLVEVLLGSAKVR